MRKSLFIALTLIAPLGLMAQHQSHADRTAAFKSRVDSINRVDSLHHQELNLTIERLKANGLDTKGNPVVQKLRKIQAEDSAQTRNRRQQLADIELNAEGFPVAPFGDTLFNIYTRVGAYHARERATTVSSKIEGLYNDFAFEPDSLQVVNSEALPEIVYRDVHIMFINNFESLWLGRKPEEIAAAYRDIIRKAVVEERRLYNWQQIAMHVGVASVIIAGICIIVFLINRLFRRIRHRILGHKDTVFKGIRFKEYQFLDSSRMLQVIFFVINIIRVVVIVIALYIALPLLFSVFPISRGMAPTLIGWIMSPLREAYDGLINYLPNLFAIFIIVMVTHYILKFLKFVAEEIHNGALRIQGFYPDWAKPTFNIVKFLIYAFSFIIIFPYLPGSESPIFRGVSVFVGILFSVGSSSAIANAVAGMVITYMRPFRLGDIVKIGEISGIVIEKNLLVTRIRTIKNEDVTLPNASILTGHTINYTTSANELGLVLHTSVTIGYDAPWKKVHELLISAAVATSGVLTEDSKKPFVFQTSLDDFYVSYQINAYTHEPLRMAIIYSDLHQNIQDKFNEAGVEIMSPHYRAGRDGNATTIPSDYLPANYMAPAFQVKVDQRPTKQ